MGSVSPGQLIRFEATGTQVYGFERIVLKKSLQRTIIAGDATRIIPGKVAFVATVYVNNVPEKSYVLLLCADVICWLPTWRDDAAITVLSG